VAGGRQRGGLDERPLVAGIARQRLLEERVGAVVVARVAGLAHLLQVRVGEVGGTVGAAAAHIGLEAGDARVGVRLRADGGGVDAAHAGRARRRPLVPSRRREHGDCEGEREDDGGQAAGSHAGHIPGGCGTGACAGSVRFRMPLNPSLGVAT
jgi:hypothetical protein